MAPIAVITGGGRGIGEATARRMAAAGWDLALGYRSDQASAETVASAVRDTGRRAITVGVDIGIEAEVESFFLNISSAAARHGSPGEYVDYAASKGAIDTFTLGLAKEVATESIRVAAVRPGIIDTEIHASGGQPDRIERIGAVVPVGRAGALLDVSGGR